MRAVLGEEKFSKLFAGCNDPKEVTARMKLELDPSVRAEVGWVDDDGEYHAPWEDASEVIVLGFRV
jgi:hypothetical protein